MHHRIAPGPALHPCKSILINLILLNDALAGYFRKREKVRPQTRPCSFGSAKLTAVNRNANTFALVDLVFFDSGVGTRLDFDGSKGVLVQFIVFNDAFPIFRAQDATSDTVPDCVVAEHRVGFGFNLHAGQLVLVNVVVNELATALVVN